MQADTLRRKKLMMCLRFCPESPYFQMSKQDLNKKKLTVFDARRHVRDMICKSIILAPQSVIDEAANSQMEQSVFSSIAKSEQSVSFSSHSNRANNHEEEIKVKVDLIKE